MDKDHASDATNLLRPSSFNPQALKSRLQQQNETAAARSTRMIIESASYETTPCSSPPDELRHVFSAKDNHHKVPDVATQTEADRVLQEQLRQQEVGNRAHRSTDGGEVPRKHDHQSIIPPYMLQAISGSEAAGPQARASASQTLASSKYGEDTRAAHGVSTQAAPLPHQNSDSGETEGRS
jgi:hypothetical protein